MMIQEAELKAAAELVARCERDLGYRLSQGQTVDLIADNRSDGATYWPLDKCREVAKRLNASWGAGAFYLEEARKA